jgi:hypothetical protein
MQYIYGLRRSFENVLHMYSYNINIAQICLKYINILITFLKSKAIVEVKFNNCEIKLINYYMKKSHY